ncbi:MAG: hypothetical protein ACUVT7_08565 [Thermoplasmata archaeon]
MVRGALASGANQPHLDHTLKSGGASDHLEFMDVLSNFKDNNVSDRLDSLSDSPGQNGIIEFVDANSDFYLDNGEFFLTKNLSRPSTVSGLMTHMFVLGSPSEPDSRYRDEASTGFCYLMTSRGVP